MSRFVVIYCVKRRKKTRAIISDSDNFVQDVLDKVVGILLLLNIPLKDFA